MELKAKLFEQIGQPTLKEEEKNCLKFDPAKSPDRMSWMGHAGFRFGKSQFSKMSDLVDSDTGFIRS